MSILSALRRLTLHDSAAFLVYFLPIGLAFSRAAGDVALSLAAVLFLAHSTMQRDWRWLREPWVMVAFAFCTYAVIIGLFAERPDKAVTRAILWIRYPIFAAALAYWIGYAPHFKKRFIATLTGACAFLIGDTALQYVTGTDLLGRAALQDLNTPRLTGPYSSGRVGISLLWMGLPVVVYWFCKSLHPEFRLRHFVWASAFLLSFCAIIFVSGERMAFLLCGLGMSATLLLAPGRLKRHALTALGGIIIVLGTLMYTNPALLERHVGESRLIIQVLPESHYARIWNSAVDIIAEHPLTGVGLRHFREECPKEMYGPEPERRCERHPHNRYLEILSETGLIGFALWVAMGYFWLRDGLRSFWANRADFFLMGLIALLIVRLWPLASTTSIMISWSAVPFWLVIGLIYTHIHTQKPHED